MACDVFVGSTSPHTCGRLLLPALSSLLSINPGWLAGWLWLSINAGISEALSVARPFPSKRLLFNMDPEIVEERREELQARKARLFEPFISNNDHFTKTGSGQT